MHTPHKVLLVEDDTRLASLVRDYLEKNDFRVAVESHGDKVIDKVEAFQPDVMILDVMLPGMSGLEICKAIRPKYEGGILILTARNDDVDQVLGLEFGADDYVVKPAEPRVLLARLRALLRRLNPDAKPSAAALTFGQLVIHPAARTVTLAEQPVSLTSHEFDLLVELAQHPGDVLTREYLFNRVYHRPYDGIDRSVDVRMSQLRKKIGDNADDPYKIKTIWGRGYLFVADAW